MRAGKRRSSRIRHGKQALKNALVEAAHAAARTKATYLQSLYKRLVSKRGKKRAMILVSIYPMVSRGSLWQDLGADYFERRNSGQIIARLTSRLQNLGCQVALTPMTA